MTAVTFRIRPAVMCPDHPDLELTPAGTGARGICPLDGATYQMETPEVAA